MRGSAAVVVTDCSRRMTKLGRSAGDFEACESLSPAQLVAEPDQRSLRSPLAVERQESLRGKEVTVANSTAIESASSNRTVPLVRRSWLLGAGVALIALLVVALFVGLYGRWVTVDRFDSGPLRATEDGGTVSGGGGGQFTISGRDARLKWNLNEGVDRVQLAVIPVSAVREFVDWPMGSVTAGDVGGVEFTSPDRSGIWSLAALPHGEYTVRHSWWTRGSETGRWAYVIEQRLAWWEASPCRRC